MKKLIYLIIIVLLIVSCDHESKSIKLYGTENIETENKYNIGEVVYLKPDSLKVVIVEINYAHKPPKYKCEYNNTRDNGSTFRDYDYVTETSIY